MFGTLARLVTCSMVAVVSVLAWRHRFLSRAVAALGMLVAAAALLSVGAAASGSSVFAVAMYVSVFGWFLWPALVGADLGVQLWRSRHQGDPPTP